MRGRVRFLIGQELRELDRVDPTMTVLDYLRLVERRVGTKEGCAEGDCGACTIALGRLRAGRVRYQAVNACILFVGQLDGAQLLTVEDLKDQHGVPHIVQQAMVDCHASQCGFCTPGFVMSLFTLYESDPKADHSDTTLTTQRIDDALAGNLCRCTGYEPIVAAARRMFELSRGNPNLFAARRPDTIARLEALDDDETVAVGDGERKFFAPATIDALADLLLEHPGACIVAGATDVGLWVTKHLRVLDPVVYIGRVRELSQLVDTGEALEIGAGVTYADARAALAALYPDMGELLRRLGGEQVRNVGTIGGNIANGSPIGDSPPPLIAAGARLVLRRGEERRELALEDFFLDYGKQDRRPSEFVEKIVVPKPAPELRFRAYKVSKRFDQDISSVLGAFALRLKDGRVTSIRAAYGGMAATPKRARHAEAALEGRLWNEATVQAAMSALERDFTPITDWRASAAYRVSVARNLLRRLFI
ncbi:MAG TPA: xanthine dehydrogenase small subunit, partial [Geminicoccaceae bacterium]|nr:xanthine dehydrogenase small subunit [Geminicoccaceae bacterium]